MALDNVMNNNLLLSILSGAGASLAGPDSVAAQAINPVVQGVIGAQSKTKEQDRQMKLLSKLLGAGVDFKSDANGKATVSGDLATLLGEEMAKQSGLGTVSDTGTPSSTPSGTAPTAPVAQPKSTQNGLLASMLNFNSSPSDVPAYSDLVGLTPKDISDSLAGAVSVEELKRQSVNDITDRLYKKALTEQAMAVTEKTRPSITIPGTDIKLNSSEYVDWYKAATKDERTNAIKNYEYAQSKGYKGSFESFQDVSKTSHQKDYAQAKAEGYEGDFNTWMLEMTKAGAINLGDVVAKREATADVDTKKYFTDPKGLVTDVDKYVNTEEVQRKLFALDPKLREIETIRSKEKYVTDKITGSGGEIIGQRLEGRTFVWTVKWPDGKITEVKYAN